MGELERRLEDVRRRKQGLVGDLVEADYEMRLQKEKVAEAARQLQEARSRLEAVEQETGALEHRLQQVRTAVAQRVSGLYQLGGRGPVRFLMSVRTNDDLLSAIRALRYLIRRDVELRRLLNETELELRRRLTALRAQRERVAELVERETGRLAELGRLRRRRAQLLAEVERTEELAAAEVASWSDRERKLGELIAGLGSGAGALAGRKIQDFRGALDRPMTGTVVRGFGPRRDPRYRTLVPHNGLRYSGLPRERVRVIYPGRVLYAEALEGYGPTVVVLHSGKVFTLYAGLADVFVRRDELLSIGQEVGVADGALYFEVRVENRPVDPERWIR